MFIIIHRTTCFFKIQRQRKVEKEYALFLIINLNMLIGIEIRRVFTFLPYDSL